MKYKELRVGDWYKYRDNYYLFTQQADGEKTSVNFTTGIICPPLEENTEIEFCPSFKVSNPNIFVRLIKDAPKGVILQSIEEKLYFIKPYTPFLENNDVVIISANQNNGYWITSKYYNCNVKAVNEATYIMNKLPFCLTKGLFCDII